MYSRREQDKKKIWPNTHAKLALVSGFGRQATKHFAPRTNFSSHLQSSTLHTPISALLPAALPAASFSTTGLLPVQQARSSTGDAAAHHAASFSASQCSCMPYVSTGFRFPHRIHFRIPFSFQEDDCLPQMAQQSLQ